MTAIIKPARIGGQGGGRIEVDGVGVSMLQMALIDVRVVMRRGQSSEREGESIVQETQYTSCYSRPHSRRWSCRRMS